MKIKKGQVLKVLHQRKGNMIVMASADFDTDDMDYWPVVLAEKQVLRSRIGTWYQGDIVPCKGIMVQSFKVVE